MSAVKKGARAKTPALAFVPQSRDAVTAAISAIGMLQRERARVQADMDDELAKVREKFEAQAVQHLREIERLSTGVQTWCEAHRDEITNGGRTKTALFASGAVTWRLTPPKCVIKGASDVLARLLGDPSLHEFVRIKNEINRDALLAEPKVAATIPGVSITQSEEFAIEPHEAALMENA